MQKSKSKYFEVDWFENNLWVFCGGDLGVHLGTPLIKSIKKYDGGKKHFQDNALRWLFFLDRPGLQSPATWSSEGLVGSREAIRIENLNKNKNLFFWNLRLSHLML
jgi:hypothetical protein